MAVDIVIGFDSLALVVAIGLSLTRGLLVPTLGFATAERNRADRLALHMLWLVATALWLTSLAWLWTRAAAMSGQSMTHALPLIPTVLFRTHFGIVWWLRAAALVWTTLMLAVMTRRGHMRIRRDIALLLFGLAWVAASRSAAGHAAAHGDWTLREGMDWLHLMAVSAWGGSLIASLLLVFPHLKHVSVENQALFAARLSLLATAALAGVLVSGIYAVWHMLPSVSDLWASYYGQVLSLKLIFVAGMIACGGINHYRLVPRLKPDANTDKAAVARQFQLSVWIESLLLLGVLAVTAVLLGSMPPMA